MATNFFNPVLQGLIAEFPDSKSAELATLIRSMSPTNLSCATLSALTFALQRRGNKNATTQVGNMLRLSAIRFTNKLSSNDEPFLTEQDKDEALASLFKKSITQF